MTHVVKSSYKNSFLLPEPIYEAALSGKITEIKVFTIDGARLKKTLSGKELVDCVFNAEILRGRKGWHEKKRVFFYTCYFE